MGKEISIITEQNHGNTWWFYALTKTIAKYAGTHHYRIEIYKSGIKSSDLKKLSDPVFIASHAYDFLNDTIRVIKSAGKHPILLTENGSHFGYGISSISASHLHQAHLIYTYLKQCKRTRIALVGFRRDYQRHLFEAMLECAPQCNVDITDRDVFYTPAGMDYFDQFVSGHSRYNAVVCPNYQVALTLLSYCKEHDIHIPDDLYIIAISNAIAMQYSDPSLTTVSIDLELMAQQCIDVWLQLSRISQKDMSVCVNLPLQVIPRSSTAFAPYTDQRTVHGINSLEPYNHSVLFNRDVSLDPVMYNLEKCLQKCDSIDIELIGYLLQDLSYETIAEKLFISIGSLKYRLSKLFGNTGTKTRTQFVAMIKETLPVDDIMKLHKAENLQSKH